MTEKEQVLQFIKNNGWHQGYVHRFKYPWKGYTVYDCYANHPFEFTGRYFLRVLVKNGKMRRATNKEIDEFINYQFEIGKENSYLDMEELSVLADNFPRLKEKMKTCNDEKELTTFFRSEVLGVDD